MSWVWTNSSVSCKRCVLFVARRHPTCCSTTHAGSAMGGVEAAVAAMVGCVDAGLDSLRRAGSVVDQGNTYAVCQDERTVFSGAPRLPAETDPFAAPGFLVASFGLILEARALRAARYASFGSSRARGGRSICSDGFIRVVCDDRKARVEELPLMQRVQIYPRAAWLMQSRYGTPRNSDVRERKFFICVSRSKYARLTSNPPAYR